MFASIDIDHDLIKLEIQQIQSRTANPSRFTTIGRRIHQLARTVKKDWDSFSVEEQQDLKDLAYQLIEPPQGLARLRLNIWAKFYTIFIVVTNQAEALFYCIDAIDTLVDNILDAVEREYPVYQRILSDTLEEVISNPEVGEPIDADSRDEWLEQLSSQAST